MVTVKIGNLFESKAQTWVNTVNCVGIMGKGVALEFKKQFPEMYADYEVRCRRKEVKLGQPYLYKDLIPPWILNFPTKDHWRSVSRIEDIVKGLNVLLANYKEWGIQSLAVPPLGCGHGQLEWRIVGPTLYRHLNRMEIAVELYAPYGTPHEELRPGFLSEEVAGNASNGSMPRAEWVQPAWVALVEILKRVEEQPYHWPVGRTTFQKIAFVATHEGLPTGLNYRRSSYGPFSDELKPAITRLVNNGLLREERLGKMFAVHTGRTFTDASKAYQAELESWEPILQKIADLFMRVNTNQAEIVATVLFAARELEQRTKVRGSEKQVLDEIMHWKQKRRPPLKTTEVAFAIRNLAALGWLNVEPSPDLPLPVEELELA